MMKNLKKESTYIAILSHDLKIPTMAQIRALELMLNGHFGNLNKEQTEIILLILDSCKYLYKIILALVISCKFLEKEIY